MQRITILRHETLLPFTIPHLLQCQVAGVAVAKVDITAITLAVVYVAVNSDAVDDGVDAGVAVVDIMLLVG